jgi:hypothetical protein
MMSLDTIIATLAIGGGALFIGEFLPQFVPPEWELYVLLVACVLWTALVLNLWKRWQNQR